ncbi:MAG: hypothetical protein GWN58_45175, partial [Anaerolineae bacterium]|nr:hypothetical protein [Anaerolineae bacterium]
MNPEPGSRGSDHEVTIMVIGDVHLGTRPTSLPPDLEDMGLDPRDLTPEAGLMGAVKRAITSKVDAVLS